MRRRRLIMALSLLGVGFLGLATANHFRARWEAQTSTCKVPGCALTLVEASPGLFRQDFTFALSIPARIGLPIQGRVDVSCTSMLPVASPTCEIVRQYR